MSTLVPAAAKYDQGEVGVRCGATKDPLSCAGREAVGFQVPR